MGGDFSGSYPFMPELNCASDRTSKSAPQLPITQHDLGTSNQQQTVSGFISLMLPQPTITFVLEDCILIVLIGCRMRTICLSSISAVEPNIASGKLYLSCLLGEGIIAHRNLDLAHKHSIELTWAADYRRGKVHCYFKNSREKGWWGGGCGQGGLNNPSGKKLHNEDPAHFIGTGIDHTELSIF
jgi:hypothetical protein